MLRTKFYQFNEAVEFVKPMTPNFRLLGVLAAQTLSAEKLASWCDSADQIWAADGAAKRLSEIGRAPHLVIGDFDSSAPHERESAETVLHLPDQDTTDCDKLLSHALETGHSFITLIDAEGGFFDHGLAVLYSCLRSPLDIRLVLERGLAYFVRPGRPLRLPCETGMRVSFLPMEPCVASLSGVQWPLVNSALSPRGAISISNRSTGTEIEAAVSEGCAILFTEHYGAPHWA